MKTIRNISRLISILAGTVLVIVAVLIPSAYFLISYQHLAGSLESEAEINGQLVTQFISANPDLWQFEWARIQEYMARRPLTKEPERRRVLDARGGVVAESIDPLPAPRISRSIALYDSGTPVGKLEVSRSLRPLLYQSGGLFLALAPLGIAIFFVLRTWPLRALERGEIALRRERDAAQRYLDIAGVMFVVLDSGRRIALINRKGCEILGGDEAFAVGKDWFEEFVPPRLRADAVREHEAMIGRGAGCRSTSEEPVLTAEGQERMIRWHRIVFDEEGRKSCGILCSGEDITDRKLLEHQLRHAQKLEAIGQLAGGVAHDLNNMLAVITGYASLLHMGMKDDDPLREDVGHILAASERGAYVTKSLLAFSRKQIMNIKPMEINQLARRAEGLLRRLIGEHITLRTICAPGGVTVVADAMQMEQVLMNLATNARDAMPQGGTLTIETGSVTADAAFAEMHGLPKEGDYALLTVTDTGVGMEPETLEKIFDPFFTTKEVGKGTGLGLSNVYGIVNQHEGVVEVSSAPGRGAQFRVYLPAVQMAPEDLAGEIPPSSPKGTETVLVVEDEVAVRSMTSYVLRRFGYSVVEAVDGDDGIRKFRELGDKVSLVLLDVIMPKKTGKEVFQDITRIRPGVKVLFTSGYDAELIHVKGILDEGKPFLPKPAAPAELLRKVREVLDA
ncbi:MAG: ATP-binding protein [Nitrospiraceae bacterium]|nr:ATP-binding protein [Nitrospiraceae bacterium]